MNKKEEFKKELEQLINKYSIENLSNTPDFILANYLLECLEVWHNGVRARENWYNIYCRPGSSSMNPIISTTIK